MTAPLIELSHVSKTFGSAGVFSRRRVRAVSDVGLALQADVAEILTIVGRSGSGKTTLARMILGMERPTAGEVRLLGKDVAQIHGAKARKAFIATVQPIFQNPFEAFNPLRRLDQYLFMTARRFGGAADRRQAHADADAALRQVGLSLAEIAGRYRTVASDPTKAEVAQKKINGIMAAATEMLMSMKTPRPGKVPLPITLSALAICLTMLGWLAMVLWGRR